MQISGTGKDNTIHKTIQCLLHLPGKRLYIFVSFFESMLNIPPLHFLHQLNKDAGTVERLNALIAIGFRCMCRLNDSAAARTAMCTEQ